MSAREDVAQIRNNSLSYVGIGSLDILSNLRSTQPTELDVGSIDLIRSCILSQA